MKRSGIRILLAVLAGGIGFLGSMVTQPRFANCLPQLLRVAAGGEASWRCVRSWGLRGQCIEPSTALLQRAPDGCGPAALAAVAGRRSPAGLSQDLLWSITRLPTGGTTLGRLSAAARRFGISCRVCWTAAPADLPCPAILHLRRGHFVVLQQCAGDRVQLFDPACGVIRVPRCELVARASGAALVFEMPAGTGGEPIPNPRPEEDR